MLIERTQTVSGVDVVLACDVLGAMHGGDGLAIEGVEHILRRTDAEPVSVVVALQSAGLIERVGSAMATCRGVRRWMGIAWRRRASANP